MAISGTPWPEPKENIINAIKEFKGVITKVAKYFNVTPLTIYNKMRSDPDVKQAVEDARTNYETNLVDLAEDTLLYTLSKRDEDPANALKSTFFVLNNKGKDRGYNRENYHGEGESFKHFSNLMNQLSSLQKDAQQEENEESK